MPLVKKASETPVAPSIPPTSVESPIKAGMSGTTVVVNKVRDFDKEARGKTRCSVWNAVAPAVIQSLGMTLDWNKPEDLSRMLAVIDSLAAHGVAYTFDELGK